VIGIRSRIGENTVIKNAIVMGNDTYQTLEQIAASPDVPLLGVGQYCHIENAILDKDCMIGDNVVIKGGPQMPDMESDAYVIRDGIVVVRKGAVLPEGTRIM